MIFYKSFNTMTQNSSSKNVTETLLKEKLSKDYYQVTFKEEMESYDELDIKEEPLDLSNEDYNCKTDSEFEYETDTEMNHHSSDTFRIQRENERIDEREEEHREKFNQLPNIIKLPQGACSTQALPNFDLDGLLREQTMFMKNMTKLLQWRKLREKDREKTAEDDDDIRKPHSLLQTLLEQSQQNKQHNHQVTFEGKRKNIENGREGNCKRQRVADESCGENSNNSFENNCEIFVKEDNDDSSPVDVHGNMNSNDENTGESSSSNVQNSSEDSVCVNEEIQNILGFFLRYPPHVFNSIWSLVLNSQSICNANPKLITNSDYEMIRESKYVLNNTSDYECNTRNSHELLTSIRQALSTSIFCKNNFEPPVPSTTKTIANHGANQPVPPKGTMSNNGLSSVLSKLRTTDDSTSENVNDSSTTGLTPGSLLDLQVKKLVGQKSSAITTENLYIDDHTLKSLSVREFNRRVSLYSVEVQTMLRKRRRTLKNRGYASSCRVKRQVYKQKLENANSLLRTQIELFKSKLTEFRTEDQSNWNHNNNSCSVAEWAESLKREEESDDRRELDLMEERDEDQMGMDDEQHSLDLQYRKQLEKFFPAKVETTEDATSSPDVSSSGGLFKNYLNFILNHRPAAEVAPPTVVAPNIVLHPYLKSIINYTHTNPVPNNNNAKTSINNDKMSRSSSSNNNNDNNNCSETSFITDEELQSLSVVDLNKRLQKLPKELQQLFKLRRRTLKNRSYAKNCRTRRIINKERLEIINTSLRLELAMCKAKLGEVGGDCEVLTQSPSSWNDYLGGRKESDNESEESLDRRDGGRTSHYNVREDVRNIGKANSFKKGNVSFRKNNESFAYRDESFTKDDEESFNNDESFSDEDESLNEWDESFIERRSFNVLRSNLTNGRKRFLGLATTTSSISENGDQEHRESDNE